MKKTPEQRRIPSTFLDEMIHRLGSQTSCHASLDVEINEVPFHVSAKGDSAIISFDRLSDALKILLDFTSALKHRKNSVENFNDAMKKLGLTLYIQNHHFGVLGPKAKTVYRNLFIFTGMLR